ncbi:hypothetical protein PHLGIDRAFT_125351 [Phlebiopsis gigantea 11061_1 CR5-6]|uniref:Uncharacterized protein n=1 Tax=Phlebiopsis gigantea (strain 11061_1 CR5-6) TaxID=745531 RepID=A0A0C3PT33_PHLG1|nr:hypothetical protein PHLGIDRAFT_125351 [Phlebiopsis gigantea 11061_1 CR5-6]
MSRLFASLGRSKKNKGRAHHDYPAYDDYGRYDQQLYEQQHYDQHYGQHYGQPPSNQHRVVPQMEPRNNHGSWGEELLEYSDTSSSRGDRRRSDSRHQRPPVHDYSVHSESTVAPLDDRYERHYGRDNAVPIVQRESSLSRLQEAFTDYGPSSRPVTQVSLPQPTPRLTPRDAVVPPVPPPMVPAEVRNVYAESRQPVLVPNTSVHSVAPEFVRSASQYRGRTDDRHRSSSRREYYSRDRSPPSDRTLEDEQQYPPCVVVVERGRNGKKDTYYVIPGGAPVVFEDDEGRELTRVGDFSGRYKPRRQRPVIIEDENGHEIGRLGFEDESSLDYAYRDRYEADFHERDREYNSRHRHRDYDHDRSSRRTPESRRYDARDYQREDVRAHSSSRGASPRSSPNVVFIPPSNTSSSIFKPSLGHKFSAAVPA